TLFSLGISPYINASIIVQLLTVAIPALERLSKEGEEGKKKINVITRWMTLGLALVSAIGVFLSLRNQYGADSATPYLNTAWLSQDANIVAFFESTAGQWVMGIYIVTMLVGGSMLTMWLGERITEYGVSNGISMIIFVGIISTAAQALFTAFGKEEWLQGGIFLVELVLVFGFIVWVDGAERKIKVQYAKQVKGNKMYGGQSTFIPIKVNASGVMPLIFAYALMSFPTMIIQTFWANSKFAEGWANWMTASTGHVGGTIIYNVVLAIMIFVFAYFYSQIQFNPVEISRNIQSNGGFVTGIRPGRETADYLSKVVSRITLWGAVFLAIVAFVPSVLFSVLGWLEVVPLDSTLVGSFSATGMMICVSVALEFNKSLENQILMRHYKGLLGSKSKGFLK
ncbi:MAG: preprotein translocase subunit SecY, partial [Clostridia bacterium]|nr:preprotein translocase subunit SecY [Clostridia bacterium]